MVHFEKPEWSLCWELAIEAYVAGSLGISAVVVDQNGSVISKGRNQLLDEIDSCNKIRRTTIAHAEINAINNIPLAYQSKRNLTIYTTVEPCPMCLGAIVMSRFRKIRVASADPHAGGIRLLEKDWYLKNKGIDVQFEQGKVEKAFFALHYLSIKRHLSNDQPHPLFTQFSKKFSNYMGEIDKLVGNYPEEGDLKKDEVIKIIKEFSLT